MTVYPLGTMLLPANRQTGMGKLIVAFCNFVNLYKNPLRMVIDAIFIIGGKG
jgi:hypothetical protein